MVWAQLAVDKPHLVYLILGGFTSLFMLCSSVIKERLYIGEATVATICGVIFGPHAANLIDPGTWGNTDRITLEFSRIVLVVQCFAVGVELPRNYMEKHWKSVVFLLIPVMTFGWLITSVFIWGLMGGTLNWLDSLVCAACVTATDPVLASSVVGRGKFAKRVPKHLRDLLSAESGCNDGMAFPFIYLALYLVTLDRNAGEVSWHWIGITILYECIFGAIYGVTVGYVARRAIRYAHERDLIDRESFLVFYFVLALFCAGSGSMLGIDDLLVGFAAGVGFSNDGWFGEKTEEAHVSNVIDLLINLAFFVYFGTIIPWAQYNSAVLGTSPWRFVVIALLVLFFRRIPIMMLLKPVIPDVKTWREALFAGHFGPIGVGAIFVAIMARAELETGTTTPLADLPDANFPHDNIIELIWPITTFLVIASILVHGSSIAVFTLGKHINTLTITMSYTQANEEGNNWMDRLPRIQSRARSISMRRPPGSEESLDEKLPDYPAATLGLPRNFLRRQKEEDNPSRSSSVSRRRRRGSRGREGGPIEDSAISPMPRGEKYPDSEERSGSDTLNPKEDQTDSKDGKDKHSSEHERKAEVYEEGDDAIIEDEEGNVLEVVKSREGESKKERNERINRDVKSLLSDQEDEEDEDQPSKKGEESESMFSKVKSLLSNEEDQEDEDHPSKRGEEPESMFSKKKSRSPPPKPQRSVSPGDRRTSDRPPSPQRPEQLRRGTSRAQAPAPERPNPLRRGTSRVAGMRSFIGNIGNMVKDRTDDEREPQPPKAERIRPHRSGPARAYRIGKTIIVEDEDGEVIKQYDIPAPERKNTSQGGSYANPNHTRARLQRMSTYLGFGHEEDIPEAGPSAAPPPKKRRAGNDEEDDERIRFTVDGQTQRMTKADFIKQIEGLHPKKRAQVVEQSSANELVKAEARADAREHDKNLRGSVVEQEQPQGTSATIQKAPTNSDEAGPEGLQLVDSNDNDIPYHAFAPDLSGRETAAQRRRRAADRQQSHESTRPSRDADRHNSNNSQQETAAERRRREGALGTTLEDSDEEDYFHMRSGSIAPTTAPRAERRPTERKPTNTSTSTSTTAAAASRGGAEGRPISSSARLGTSSNVHAEGETAAERRRREAALGITETNEESSGSEREHETAAEKRRREAALGVSKEDSDTESDDNANTDRVERLVSRGSKEGSVRGGVGGQMDAGPVRAAPSMGIRFAEPTRTTERGDEEEGGWGGSSRAGKRKLRFGLHRRR